MTKNASHLQQRQLEIDALNRQVSQLQVRTSFRRSVAIRSLAIRRHHVTQCAGES